MTNTPAFVADEHNHEHKHIGDSPCIVRIGFRVDPKTREFKSVFCNWAKFA